MIHVKDTASAQALMLELPTDRINGRRFNVGSPQNTYRIRDLADIVSAAMARPVEIEWYGDPDHRSYRVAFDRIGALGWRAEHTAEEGVSEIAERLEAGTLDRTTDTITLEWYKTLQRWHRIIHKLEMYGGILDLDAPADSSVVGRA